MPAAVVNSGMDLRTAREALKTFFGYEKFRPNQAEIIETIIAERDCLVIMPTGGGKSICFQIPAIILDGICVVVSPLIALMEDQVSGLKANGVAAAYLNSTQSYKVQQEISSAATKGEIDILYVSPEKLLSQDFVTFLKTLPLRLIAVDEAHCISAWGHDFRPEYTKLSFLKQTFPLVPMVALTATADRATREDIIRQLNLDDPVQFIASFDRPNLSLEVLPGRNKLSFILQFIRQRPGESGIIYCLSRKGTEGLAAKLKAQGINATHYHGGMNAKERAEAQHKFISDEVPIVCATIAFGMGIDKSNVRWVIHHNLPKNIESYYQEIGRAGRDGLDSETILFYSYADVISLQKFAADSGQAELQMAKLERMMQYAEAQICRRKILLSYFGQHLEENCQNCDVCNNPPKQFDGTQIAQMALSALVRLDRKQEKVGMNLLIDILRGSGRKEIRDRGLDQIKTFGAGRDIPMGNWIQAILQMLHLGLVEIAYHLGNTLQLTEASWAVLKGERKVELVKFESWKDRQEKKTVKPKTKAEQFQDALFGQLKLYRQGIAADQNIAPHLVFGDVTLEEMAAKCPANEKEMRAVSGVSAAKFKQFGDGFIEEILKFIVAENRKGRNGLKPKKGSSFLVTLYLFNQGMDFKEIAKRREISPMTVIGHLAHLIEHGHYLEVKNILPGNEWQRIEEAIEARGGPQEDLGPFYNYLGGQIHYSKIRLVIAYKERMEPAR